MAFGLTDPALEIADLAKWFKRIPVNNQNVSLFERIAQVTGVATDDPVYYEMIAAVPTRLRRLSSIREQYFLDKKVENFENEEIRIALRNISQLFSPGIALTGWQSAITNFVKDADIVSLLSFSHVIQEECALKRVNASDTIATLAQIQEKISEVSSDETLEPWIKKYLVEGLARLTWAIKHLNFFGHDAIFDQLFALKQRVDYAISKEPDESRKSKLYQVVLFIGALATAYAAADTTYNATQDYIKILHGHEAVSFGKLPVGTEIHQVHKQGLVPKH